jgi:hypothetical protein
VPPTLDPALEQELDAFRQMVAARSIDDFYAGEAEEMQDYGSI